MAKNLPNSTKLINKFEGILAARLYKLAAQLDYRCEKINRQKLLTSELAWVELAIPRSGGENVALLINPETKEESPIVLNSLELQRYRTLILILRDTLNLSWQLQYSAPDTIEIIPPSNACNLPTSKTQDQEKKRVRQELLQVSQEQFSRPTVQKFILSMEKPNRHAKHKSILNLIADGEQLANNLEKLSELPPTQYLPHLQKTIQPYLQLVNATGRDEFTNIKYSDIWRYFRFSWVIPNTSVPGRNLFYLVRDAAQPNHPVMAIAALSNAALQLRDRDDFIGWTRETYIALLEKAIKESNVNNLKGLINLAENYVNKGLNEVDIRGFVTTNELAEPKEEVLKRLQTQIAYHDQLRQQYLTNIGNEQIVIDNTQSASSNLEIGMSGVGILPEVSNEILLWDTKASIKELPARRQMILKKRAQTLYQLLNARFELQKLKETHDLLNAVTQALHQDSFLAALTSIIRSGKSEKIGINMLDITTCGAIPPYNYLLGGKLMALLMLSPQVAQDYKQRYGDKPSIIASQVKGEKVVRDCQLVFLSTTSLYAAGSSQYNRVSLPAKTFHPEQPRLLYQNQHKNESNSKNEKWQTTGFGTVQFSKETSDAVVKLGKLESGYQDINNIFGEGSSPKLRKMREGLEAVGLSADVLLRHRQPRLLYCVELAPDSRAFLRGEETTLPEYILDPESVPNATNVIVTYWRERWLSKRILNKDIIELLSSFKVANHTLTTRFSSNVDKPEEAN